MDTRHTLFRYIILIPHRDALKSLEEYRRRLFANGLAGAHSFPLAAPLAEVTHPFSREELKELARNIRDLTRERDGKILSRGTAIVSGSGMSFFGPRLDIPVKEDFFPQTAKGKLLSSLLPPVLCAAIVDAQASAYAGSVSAGLASASFSDKNFSSEKAPVFSFRSGTEALPGLGGGFRAASLANLVIRPLAGADCSFEWKISPPVWLPAYKKGLA